MDQEALARLMPEPAALPCGVFLDAPNEIAAPDFGLFRDTLNSHFYPAHVESLDRHTVMRDPWLTALHLTLTTIGYVRFGATASVDPGDLPAYHVNVVLSGTVDSCCGDQQAIASPQVAAVFSPHRHTSLPRWDADAAQLSIKFERTHVEQELAGLLGRPVVKPIDFRLALPVDDGAGRRWMSVLSALLQSADGPRGPAELRHLESLERSLISGLLVSQVHSYTDLLTADPARPAPQAAVDRVVEEIQRAPDRDYTVADLARIAGTSARSLQYAFHDQHGTTPMRYLRQVRLDRAREDLAQAHGSVADIACYWGFTNPGRFARAYRDRFGEFPADTLDAGRTPRARH
jgi:AraC-like DNA-binding protein